MVGCFNNAALHLPAEEVGGEGGGVYREGGEGRRHQEVQPVVYSVYLVYALVLGGVQAGAARAQADLAW